MTGADETWIDGGIGETRVALVRRGKPFALKVLRWSEAGRRALWGETYDGRVVAVDRARRGAFVELGLRDEQGFLPLNAAGETAFRGGEKRIVREGQRIAVRVTREGVRNKGPALALLAAPAEGGPRRTGRHESDSDLDGAPPASPDIRSALDEAFDLALDKHAPIPGGGMLTIEPTAALVAVDVDSASRSAFSNGAEFIRRLNMDAANETIRQLRLRALGGLAAIDFVSMRAAEDRRAVEATLKEAAAGDPWEIIVAPMSRFGIVELSRAQMTRPVHEIFCGEDGRKNPETLALEALRAMEREYAAARGRFVEARLPSPVAAWLDADVIPWRAALDARIGARWSIAADPQARGLDVRAV